MSWIRNCFTTIVEIILLLILTFSFSGCTSPENGEIEKKPSPIADHQEIPPSPSVEIDPFETLRNQMVDRQIQARGISNKAVLSAMRSVPRHEFVLDRFVDYAYDDTPLPINNGQTISQPYIVALMTELLNVNTGDKVLEVGTGSGYQAAILAQMGIDVYSVEIIPELSRKANELLDRLEYNQVKVLNSDGYFGWEQYAPFNAIIVTAAPDHLPQPLIKQLVDGGHMVIPIGPVGAVQTLWLFRNVNGEIQAQNMGAVTFVPLTGDH